ncbi:MAG: hypothetical protein ACK54X_22665 [Burkholderiales bacterium]|jgi:hypothetical protein
MSARKTRPARGTPITAGMSVRDIAAALGWSTAQISRAKQLADIPLETFDAIVDGYQGPEELTVQRIIDLSRGWDTSSTTRERVCPHCGKTIPKRGATR